MRASRFLPACTTLRSRVQLRIEHGGSAIGEVIETPRFPWRILFRELRDDACGEKRLQVVVKSSGPEFVLAAGDRGDLLHDAVAMEIAPGEREQDMGNGIR